MKYIYLDQNKWIELARGLKLGDTEYIELKNRIDSKIHAHEWAFPVSLIHLAETMKRNDDTSRKNVLDLMFELSNGYGVCDYSSADRIEFDSWLEYSSVNHSKLTESIICDDYANIIGVHNQSILDSVIESVRNESNVANQKIENAHIFIEALKKSRFIFDYIASHAIELSNDESFYYNQYQKAKEKFDKWVDYCKSLDEYKKKHLFPAYTIKMFFAEYEKKISVLSKENQEKIKTMFMNPDKDPDFLESLPGFNIYNRLVYELFTSSNREISSHDFYDIAFLRVAIPYCDIVVCEKHWGHTVSKLKLDTKYHTVVTKNIMHLLEM